MWPGCNGCNGVTVDGVFHFDAFFLSVVSHFLQGVLGLCTAHA